MSVSEYINFLSWEKEEREEQVIKELKSSKRILTVFIMDACFCKHSRDWIAFRVTEWTGFVSLPHCILVNASRARRVPVPMSELPNLINI